MRLSGTTSVITGASSGIGAAIAVALAAAGSRPLLVARDAGRLRDVARRAGGVPIVADLASPEGTRDAADRALEYAEHVDVLVHNAGIGWAGSLDAMSEDDVVRLAEVNLVAPIHLTRRLLPHMTARAPNTPSTPSTPSKGGHVLFVTSIAGCTGVRDEAVYAATKAGLHTFAECLRYELAGSGVDVSVVVPGVVATPFFERRGAPYARRWPRPVPAERVARAAVAALEHDRAEVFVPRWMRLPARLQGGMPATYRRLAGRFG